MLAMRKSMAVKWQRFEKVQSHRDYRQNARSVATRGAETQNNLAASLGPSLTSLAADPMRTLISGPALSTVR